MLDQSEKQQPAVTAKMMDIIKRNLRNLAMTQSRVLALSPATVLDLIVQLAEEIKEEEHSR